MSVSSSPARREKAPSTPVKRKEGKNVDAQGLTSRVTTDLAMVLGLVAFFAAYSARRFCLRASASASTSSSSEPKRSISSSSSSTAASTAAMFSTGAAEEEGP